MDSISEILEIPEVALIAKLFVATCLIVIAMYGVLKIRDFAAGTMPKNGEYITDFEIMRDQGLIDDKELSRVKTAAHTAENDPTNPESTRDPTTNDGFDG